MKLAPKNYAHKIQMRKANILCMVIYRPLIGKALILSINHRLKHFKLLTPMLQIYVNNYLFPQYVSTNMNGSACMSDLYFFKLQISK